MLHTQPADLAEPAGSNPAIDLVAVLSAVLPVAIFAVLAVADRKEKKGTLGRFMEGMVARLDKTNTLVDGIENFVGNWLPLSHFFQRYPRR